MDARLRFILNVLKEKVFEIPDYQRNYDWDKINVTRLFKDFDLFLDEYNAFEERIKKNEDKEIKTIFKEKQSALEYFLGSLVTVQPTETQHPHLIIDGQQRTTTICLILVALKNIIIEKKLKNQQDYKEIIDEINRILYETDNANLKIRLKPIETDRPNYEKLVSNDIKDLDKKFNIINNYNYIKKELENRSDKKENFIKLYWSILNKIRIVFIEIKASEKPQKIFETINSTGKPLAVHDLIRNYVMMSFSEDTVKAKQIYNDYWKKIENNYKNYSNKDIDKKKSDDDEFLRYFLIYKKQNTVSVKRESFFNAFKETYEKISESDLNEILFFSNVYYEIKSQKYDDLLKCNILSAFNFLGFSSCLSILFEFFGKYKKEEITPEQTLKCLKILESYYVGIKIVGSDKNFNKDIPLIIKEIDKKYCENNNYLEAVRLSFTKKIPSKDIFKNNLKFFNLYRDKKFCKYFLLNLECYNNNNLGKIKQYFDDPEISIEHIFPQDPNNWRVDIQDEFEFKQLEENTHNIGNLTLIARKYNSEMSNKRYVEKKKIENGIAKSPYRFLNDDFEKLDVWNLHHLNKRKEKLIERALSVWKYEDVSDYKIVNRLKLDDNPTSTKPSILNWNNKKIFVKSWVEVFIKIIEDIYDNNPEKFSRLVKQSEFSRVITFNKEIQTKPYQLDANIFIEKNLGANDIFKNLIKIITCFDEFDVDDVLIEVTQELEMVD